MIAAPPTGVTVGAVGPTRREPDVVRDELLAGAEALAPELGGLIRSYFRHVPTEELGTDRPDELAAVVGAHRRLAEDRVPGRAAIRLVNPERTGAGWTSSSTVVQVVTDDMPYLVDSVVAELARIAVPVNRLVHPIVVVRRDVAGTLLEVLPLSLIHI